MFFDPRPCQPTEAATNLSLPPWKPMKKRRDRAEAQDLVDDAGVVKASAGPWDSKHLNLAGEDRSWA